LTARSTLAILIELNNKELTMDKEQFKRDPRSFAMSLVYDGVVDPMLMLQAAMNWLSTDEVRDMLDANELSPRFSYDEELDEDLV
jgi:hypothetical protein